MFFGTLGPQYTWRFFRLSTPSNTLNSKGNKKENTFLKDLFMRNSMVFLDRQSDFFLRLGGKNSESI